MAGHGLLFADQWANRDNLADGSSSPDPTVGHRHRHGISPGGDHLANGDWLATSLISRISCSAALKENAVKLPHQPPVALATVQHRKQIQHYLSSFSASRRSSCAFATRPSGNRKVCHHHGPPDDRYYDSQLVGGTGAGNGPYRFGLPMALASC